MIFETMIFWEMTWALNSLDNETFFREKQPDVVVMPQNVEQVSAIM